jgi:hypothetical protein
MRNVHAMHAASCNRYSFDFFEPQQGPERGCHCVATCLLLINKAGAQVDIKGVPVTLLDTAGIRHTDDTVEAAGVQRSSDAATAADIVLFVYDAEVRSSCGNRSCRS